MKHTCAWWTRTKPGAGTAGVTSSPPRLRARSIRGGMGVFRTDRRGFLEACLLGTGVTGRLAWGRVATDRAPEIPDRHQLSSEIVIAMVDGKEVFLDPGTPFCPFGHLAWQHNSTKGIRQTQDGNTVVAQTPGADYKEAVSKRVARLALSDDGTAKGKIGIAWAGEEALVHRLSGLKTDAPGRKKELEDELKAVLPAGAIVQLETSNGWDDSDLQLTANFTVEIPGYASNAGKRLMVPRDLFHTRSRTPFAHGDRKNPVYFSYPFYSADETTVTYPEALHLESSPDSQPVQTDFSFYRMRHTTGGNSVTVNRDFAIGGIGFQATEYANLRKFYDAVTSGDSEPLVLTAAK